MEFIVNAIPVISIVVAVIALFRPEWSGLFRRWRNIVKLYPYSRCEIGFSDFGPTLGIIGTLVVSHQDEFVSSVNVMLKRGRDGASYNFEWAAFRNTNLMKVHEDIQAATGFLLKKNESHKFNILFSDSKTRDEFGHELLSLRTSFENFGNYPVDVPGAQPI